MKVDLEKLKELAERATPGPWEFSGKNGYFSIRIESHHGSIIRGGANTTDKMDCSNMSYIAAINPDVMFALIAEIERLRMREADYRQYLAGIRQGLELREADEKENEEELEKALAEVERLKKLSVLWKRDYEGLAASASDARKKNERLEKEADWLAHKQNFDVPAEEPTRCPPGYKPPKDCMGWCCQFCWREAARKAVEEKENG